MVKKLTIVSCFLLTVSVLLVSSCGTGDDSKNQPTVKKVNSTAPPDFVIGLKAMEVPVGIPLVQSGAWAIQGNKLLLIGGRIQGFHGLAPGDTLFNQRYANQSIWVLDLSNFSWSRLTLNLNNSQLLPLCASSIEFFQDNDSLYLVGGYGIQKQGNIQSNYTYNTLYVISVSAMINAVETQGDPTQAILMTTSSPYLQVTGGALFKSAGLYYLLFGQNYPRVYHSGVTGKYTSAVRIFNLSDTGITVIGTCTDSLLHRRDLNVVTITHSSGNFIAGFGGVFTPDDDGYERPVYFFPGQGCKLVQDTLHQLTNQYNCAQASIYDSLNDINVTVLMGGIGKYQYDEETGKWENGDDGAKLPFVKTITQMIFSNNQMQQKIQLPPGQPEMPGLIGANAIFIPDSTLLYQPGVIDYGKITADTTVIGLLYGGIKSSKPTSSPAYPTTVNSTVYQVLLYKQSSGTSQKSQ